MTLKIIGMTAVIASSWIIGVIFSMKSYFRLEDIEELKKAVTIFLNDTVNSSMALSVVFKDISQKTKGGVSAIFKDAENLILTKNGNLAKDMLKKAIDKNIKNTYFEYEELECFYSFANSIDSINKEQQRNNARLLIDSIQILISDINKKAAKERRLYNSAGILCGILICVVLV